MKRIAIIGGGEMASYYGESCKRLGYESHYFSLPDGKVEDGKVDVYHNINIFDKERIVEICRALSIDGVVPTTELSVAVTSYVASKLNLPGLPLEVAEVITDKFRNRECIKSLSNLKSPKYVIAHTLKEIQDSALCFPIILKPTNLGGKRGLIVVEHESDLQNAYDFVASFLNKTKRLEIIAEEFLTGGQEYSVESISVNGHHNIIQITQKDSSGPPHCVELGHHQPASISPEDWVKVEEAVKSGLSAVGINYGPCHTEIKLIDGKVYLIEFNARPGGDHIWVPLVELSTGFDIMGAVVQVAAGEIKEINKDAFQHNFAGMYYVVQQTKFLKPIFDSCEKEEWCVMKNFISEELVELKGNNRAYTNYMIYSSSEKDPIADLFKK